MLILMMMKKTKEVTKLGKANKQRKINTLIKKWVLISREFELQF